MRRVLTLVFSIVVLFSVKASAQTADEIIKKHLDARGGVEKIKAVKSVKVTLKNGEFEATIGKELSGINSKLAAKKLEAIKALTKEEYDKRQQDK